MDAVKVENLSFKYGKNVVFDGISFNVEKGSFLTVVGKGGSGKSTLFRILSLEYGDYHSISFFGRTMRYSIEKGEVGYISLSLDYFHEKSVFDELLELLRSKGVSSDKIKGRLDRVIRKLGLEYMINYSIYDLSDKDRILLMFAYQILKRPKLLILDNVLSYLDREYTSVVRELIRFGKRCTIINITNDTSECLIGKKVYFLDKNEMHDVDSLNDEVFLESGLRVPFMLLLSSRLKSYDLIEKNYTNEEVLVDDLWK